MVEIFLPQDTISTLPASELLYPGEVVVVVDDSPEIVLLLAHYLRNQGFSVVSAGSAGEFYDLLQREKIGLVLLDIGLPDQNGNEILVNIAPNHPDLAIIMVTGTTDIEVALECLRQGADDYLTKPIGVERFNYTIKNT
jgi:DNA-binding response OmpR family regulator